MDGFGLADTDILVVTVDRVLRVVGNAALFITACWRNIYQFKYPRLAQPFFSLLLLLFLLADASQIFQLLVFGIISTMVYNYPSVHKYLTPFLDLYIFSHKHNHHLQPECLSSN